MQTINNWAPAFSGICPPTGVGQVVGPNGHGFGEGEGDPRAWPKNESYFCLSQTKTFEVSGRKFF